MLLDEEFKVKNKKQNQIEMKEEEHILSTTGLKLQLQSVTKIMFSLKPN